MVTRTCFGREYKLIASTDKRVGTVLMAIRRVDLLLSKNKRPRIEKKSASIKVGGKYSNFEEELAKQIEEFKRRKQVVV